MAYLIGNTDGSHLIFEVLPFLETNKTIDYKEFTDLVPVHVPSTRYF